MRVSMTIDQAKEQKLHDKCPNCKSDLINSTFSEDGEQISCRRCSKKCGWWGS